MPRFSIIQEDEDQALQSQEEFIQHWTKYYTELYNAYGRGDTIVRDFCRTVSIIVEELQHVKLPLEKEAIPSLKGTKSLGSDAITGQIMQAEGKAMILQIRELFSKAWNDSTIPEE